MNPVSTFGRTDWMGDQSINISSAYTGKHNIKKGHISMPPEPTIIMFERAVLDK